MKAKRILSFALTALMALSLITVGAAAEDSPNLFYNGSFDNAANLQATGGSSPVSPTAAAPAPTPQTAARTAPAAS